MEPGSQAPPPTSRTIKILIVDDSAVVRASVSGFLALHPRVEVVGMAADGREALALLVHRKADLVVMDLDMPVMDGLQTMRRIRERHAATRVVIMTMYSESEVKARCLEGGADAFILKQDLQRELHDTLARLFPELSPANRSSPKPRRP
jgi:DNA-binding NarL/FixJ family response regulator